MHTTTKPHTEPPWAELRPEAHTYPWAKLRGKVVWLRYDHAVDVARQLATKRGARHYLYGIKMPVVGLWYWFVTNTPRKGDRAVP